LQRDISAYSAVSVRLEWKASVAESQQDCPNTELRRCSSSAYSSGK